MSGDKGLTNTKNNDIIFSIRVDLTEEEGFVVNPVAGKIPPTVADMLLALQVARDAIMNEYYTNMANAYTSEESSGVEGVVKKAEGYEV